METVFSLEKMTGLCTWSVAQCLLQRLALWFAVGWRKKPSKFTPNSSPFPTSKTRQALTEFIQERIISLLYGIFRHGASIDEGAHRWVWRHRVLCNTPKIKFPTAIFELSPLPLMFCGLKFPENPDGRMENARGAEFTRAAAPRNYF